MSRAQPAPRCHMPGLLLCPHAHDAWIAGRFGAGTRLCLECPGVVRWMVIEKVYSSKCKVWVMACGAVCKQMVSRGPHDARKHVCTHTAGAREHQSACARPLKPYVLRIIYRGYNDPAGKIDRSSARSLRGALCAGKAFIMENVGPRSATLRPHIPRRGIVRVCYAKGGLVSIMIT